MPYKHETFEDEPNILNELPNIETKYDGIITTYDKKYCELLISHCSNGGSVEGFSGRYHINPDSLEVWIKEDKEFRAVCKCAYSLELDYYNNLWLDILKKPDLSYMLPSITRKLAHLESLLLKNSIRKSLFSTYEDIPILTKEEEDSINGLNNFIGM